MKKAAVDANLSWGEVGYIAQGLSLANRKLKQAVKGVTVEYDLGPRGAWIVRLIDGGGVTYPLDVTNFFDISRSVITDELARLIKVRLIEYRKSKQDGRRVELVLTPLGKQVSRRVRKEVGQLIAATFSSYSQAEVQQFRRMLDAFVSSDGAPPAGSKRNSTPSQKL